MFSGSAQLPSPFKNLEPSLVVGAGTKPLTPFTDVGPVKSVALIVTVSAADTAVDIGVVPSMFNV